MSSATGKLLTLTWKIENYSLCRLKNGEYLKSHVISTEDFEDTKWFLSLYPKGVDKNSSDFISCFFYRNENCEKSKSNFSASCSLNIIDPNGKILASMENKTLGEMGQGLHKFLKIEQLANDMKNWKNDILEIRCQLFGTNYNGQPILCETHTEIQMKKHLFDWKITIPEFQEWSKNMKCQFEAGTPINIALTTLDNKVYLKFHRLEKPSLSELCKLKISILNKKGIDIILKKSTHVFESSEFETSFEKGKLEHKSVFTFIYSFKLICAVYISNGTVTSTFVSYSYENAPVNGLEHLAIPRLSLQNDLKDMFLNKKHSDVELRADNEMFPAHKCLLSARSPVFSAMFDRDMLESQTGIVDIPDVERETLRAFVEFLYTETFPNTDHDHVLKLMLVADKYQVNVLKEGCSEILMSKLSLENVCDVISVADSINQLDLKQSAVNYIKANRSAILLSPDWLEWVTKNTKLAIEILTKLSLD